MGNEAKTENLVRDLLREHGYYDNTDITVEEKKTNNPKNVKHTSARIMAKKSNDRKLQTIKISVTKSENAKPQTINVVDTNSDNAKPHPPQKNR